MAEAFGDSSGADRGVTIDSTDLGWRDEVVLEAPISDEHAARRDRAIAASQTVSLLQQRDQLLADLSICNGPDDLERYVELHGKLTSVMSRVVAPHVYQPKPNRLRRFFAPKK